MKSIAILFAFILSSSPLFAQDVTQTILDLERQNKCDEIIEKYAPGKDTLSAIALQCIGTCYLKQNNRKIAEEYLDLAIKKDPIDPMYVYNKALMKYTDNKLSEAIKYWKKAIDIATEDTSYIIPNSYYSIGDSYSRLYEKDSAVEYLKKAIKYPNCPVNAYPLLGSLYWEKSELDTAAKYYSIGYEKVEPGSKNYEYIFTNYGLILQLLERHADALKVYLKHEEQNPKDYLTTSKIIQCYYGLGEYEKAKPFKDKIYAAQKVEKMPEGMEVSFVIDIYARNSTQIMVFERYEVSKTETDAKYRFYVSSRGAGQKKYVDAESIEGKDVRYMLVLTIDGKRYTFPQFIFPENFNYSEMKSAVMQILEGRVEPIGEGED